MLLSITVYYIDERTIMFGQSYGAPRVKNFIERI
jgi:hypothetical protein